MADEEKAETTEQPTDAQTRIMELQNQLTERDQRIAALEGSVSTSQKELTDARTSLGQAVASYKTLVTQANPDVLAELISGDSVAIVDQSLQSAKELVGRVKKTIATETAATRIPAGAPQRTALDVSALSAREKIHYGLGK